MWVGLFVRKCHGALWASDCDQSVRAERLEPWLWTGNTGSSKGPATGSCSCVHYGPSSFSSLWLVPSLHKETVLPQRLYFSFSCQLCFPLQYCWELTQFVISCTGVLSVSFCVLWGGWGGGDHKIKEMGNRTSHYYTNSSLHSNNEKCFPSSVLQFQSYSLTWGLGEQREVKTLSNLLAHCGVLKAGYRGE